MTRKDLEGRLPVVYNGKSAEEWYTLYCQLLLKSEAYIDALPTGTEARICDDIAERQRLGINEYGTTVEDNPLSLRECLVHAYQESLDLSVYLKRAIEELDRR